jgi:NADH dehydrogenase FAD-containing subunit
MSRPTRILILGGGCAGITPIRRLCPDTNLYTRTVECIDLDRRHVETRR